MASTECPTPRKHRFATLEAAEAEVKTASFVLSKTLYPYDTCPCGWIHLTSKRIRANQSVLEGTASAHPEFMMIVRSDVKCESSEEDSQKLRQPENLARWREELGIFRSELMRQFEIRKQDQSPEMKGWRSKMERVLYSINVRMGEARALINEQRLLSEQQNEEKRQLREDAGERAIDRLIKAHQDEFTRYLVEEYGSAGVEVPRRVARHAELRELEGESSE